MAKSTSLWPHIADTRHKARTATDMGKKAKTKGEGKAALEMGRKARSAAKNVRTRTPR